MRLPHFGLKRVEDQVLMFKKNTSVSYRAGFSTSTMSDMFVEVVQI